MPKYDLHVAKRLVENGKLFTTTRVENELQNHEYVPEQTVREVFSEMEETDFYKTTTLVNHPRRVTADVYKVEIGEVEWYVKYFIDETDEVHVQIWSLKWW